MKANRPIITIMWSQAAILGIVFSLLLAPSRASAQADESIGLVFFDGVKIETAAVQSGGLSPFKIRKNGQDYGIKLVAPSDPDATRWMIRHPDGTTKAVKRYNPCNRVPLEPIPPAGLCLGSGTPTTCIKHGPGVEFYVRHLWSNKHQGGPAYNTPIADQLNFYRDIIELDTGPLDFSGGKSWGVDCGDNVTFQRVCNEWGYANFSAPYNHVNASPANNCSVKWNGTQWVSLGCGRPCNNKRLVCTNPLPKCRNNYDDDGDCTSDFGGNRRGDPLDPQCSSLTDNNEAY